MLILLLLIFAPAYGLGLALVAAITAWCMNDPRIYRGPL